jgi:hypothetical protein
VAGLVAFLQQRGAAGGVLVHGAVEGELQKLDFLADLPAFALSAERFLLELGELVAVGLGDRTGRVALSDQVGQAGAGPLVVGKVLLGPHAQLVHLGCAAGELHAQVGDLHPRPLDLTAQYFQFTRVRRRNGRLDPRPAAGWLRCRRGVAGRGSCGCPGRGQLRRRRSLGGRCGLSSRARPRRRRPWRLGLRRVAGEFAAQAIELGLNLGPFGAGVVAILEGLGDARPGGRGLLSELVEVAGRVVRGVTQAGLGRGRERLRQRPQSAQSRMSFGRGDVGDE